MMLMNNAEALVRLNGMDKAALEAVFGTKAAVSGKIVGALPNQDTDGMKNALLHSNPAGVIAGLKILTILTGAEGAELSVTCPVNRQELDANAGIVDLNLTVTEETLVNVRAHAADLLVTLDELAAMAEKLMDNTPGVLVAVDDNEAQEIAPETPVSTLIGEGKGVFTDHKFYTTAEAAALTAGGLVSGVLHTIKDTDCVVDMTAKDILRLRQKSCGKCTFCREGLYQLEQAVEEVATGRSKPQDKDFMLEMAEAMTVSCNCSLGDTAGLAALTMCKSFDKELDAHMRRKECPAGVCLALTQFYIDPALCKGDGKCAEVCPAKAIECKDGYVSVLETFDCTRCGQCLSVCAQGAVKKVSGKLPKLPSKPVKIKGAKTAAAAEKTERTAIKRKRVFAAAAPAPKKAAQASAPAKMEKVKVNIVKTLTTDLVIVAGGPAGLAAAIAAGEKGLKTIILEKSSTTGGAANMGMGPLGIDTKIQRAAFNNISVEDALKLHMEYTHWNVDADLVSTYFAKSADTIEWLQDMGVEFAGAFRYFKESEATWHIVKPENGVIGPRAASAMIKKMTERAKELGCEIMLNTPATSLIQENGKVCGAVAVDADGNGIEVRGKAVVVATGGFGNNKQMVHDEFGLNLGEDFFPFMIPGITGDGLRMMWDVGATKFGTNIEAIFQLPDNLNWFLLDAVLRQPNLLINQNGDRFMNEGMMGNTTFTGNALRLQPGNYGYCIMDEGILREYKKNGPDIVDIVHPAEAFIAFEGQAAVAVEQNYPAYFEAETIPELAEKLGIDADKLQDTIDEYNEMCATGVDTKFFKNHNFLHPITGKGKYLVGKFYLAAYGTVGGVRINKFCEVLNDQYMPIEGLYSAGTDANTIYGDSYNFTLCGNTMGFAVNTGRMAGESAADYIAELG